MVARRPSVGRCAVSGIDRGRGTGWRSATWQARRASCSTSTATRSRWAVDKVGEFAKEKFGHEEQIDAGVEKLKDLIPGGEGEAPAQA